MNEQKILSKRIEQLCAERGMSYYVLSFKSAVPMTTLMHIINCSTKNPGIFTVMKICDGLGITVSEFFETDEFLGMEKEVE